MSTVDFDRDLYDFSAIRLAKVMPPMSLVPGLVD